MVTLKELKPFYYTALDLGVILSKANLTVIEFSNVLKQIAENEKDLIALKYKNDRRKLFLAASYWSYYFVDKEALDAEFPAIKKLLSTKDIKISDGDFTADYSDLDLFFKSIRLRILYIGKQDYVRIKLRTLLKRYGLKRRSQKFIDKFLLCIWFYQLQIYLPGNKECDILSSIPKNFFCLFHVRNGVNSEGAAFGAGAAGNAVAGVGFKRCIVFAHGFRHFALRFGKVQKLGYVCHVNAFGARRAMAAVHAMPFPADFGEACPQYMQCPSQLILGKLAKTSA